MALKIRDITLVEKAGTFDNFLNRFTKPKEKYDFESLSDIRKILSNEKARLLYTIKSKNPQSIYSLAKILGRDFKSVCEDIKLLERFGFIELISEKTGNRSRLKPIIVSDSIRINISI